MSDGHFPRNPNAMEEVNCADMGDHKNNTHQESLNASERLRGEEETVADQDDRIIDLVDVIDDENKAGGIDQGMDKEIERKIIETAERIAREIFPSIAERIIREEIEKLKNEE